MNGDVGSEVRELDRRSGDGVDVALLWSSRTGQVYLAVEDLRTETGFHVAVDPSEALDAFRHPYAYGTRRADPARDDRSIDAVRQDA